MTDDRSFTIRDRRSFTADGELREGAAEAPPATPTPVEPQPTLDGARREGDAPAATLETLFGDFAAAAAFHLGLIREQVGADAPPVDLAAARHAISMLELLSEKTRGNRTAEEDQLLERLLFELRLAWVARSRGGAA